MTAHLITFRAGATSVTRQDGEEAVATREYFISRGGSVSQQGGATGPAEVIVGSGINEVVILVVEL